MAYKAVGFDYFGVLSTNGNAFSALLVNLRARGYANGVISNAQSDVSERLRKQRILPLLDVVVTSGQIGAAKPDPKIFQAFTEQLGIELAELVYIDDSPEALATASTLGYTPLLFNGLDLLHADLARLGVLSLSSSLDEKRKKEYN